MSFEIATIIADSIMSFEDSESTKVSLAVRCSHSTDEHHVYCLYSDSKNPENNHYDVLFRCHDDLPFYSSFSFEPSLDLTTFFRSISASIVDDSVLYSSKYPNDYQSIEKFNLQTNIIWIKRLFACLMEQTGPDLFLALTNSILTSFYIKFEYNGEIVLCFAKHSDYLHKNINFQIELDMSFNVQSISFKIYDYLDSYQEKALSTFSYENKLIAFYVLLSYYCCPMIHKYLDAVIDVNADLNDSNICDYANITNMIKI